MNSSGRSGVPVTYESPIALQHDRRRRLDLHRPLEVERELVDEARPTRNGSDTATTTAVNAASPGSTRSRSPRPTSHATAIGTSSAGKSLVAVPSAERRERPRRPPARERAASAPATIAAGSAS